MPKYSIIIPIYKVESYISQCIESVLCQTFTDYELILVDDGSPDECPKICDNYKALDDRIIVVHQKNGGSSSARNAGLSIARGEYVLFIDGDDYWNNDSCLSLLSAEIAGSESDIIVFRFARKYLDGREVVTRKPFDIDKLYTIEKNERLSWMVQHHTIPGAAWSMCVRRDLIEKNSLRFKQGVTGEDFDWVLQLLHHAHNIGFVNEPFYVYRIREGSITTKAKLSGVEGISYAIRRWFAMSDRSMELDRYLLQVYCVELYGLKGLMCQDARIAKTILEEDAMMFRTTRYRIVYPVVNILGVHNISSILHWIYDIRMKLLSLKSKNQ